MAVGEAARCRVQGAGCEVGSAPEHDGAGLKAAMWVVGEASAGLVGRHLQLILRTKGGHASSAAIQARASDWEQRQRHAWDAGSAGCA